MSVTIGSQIAGYTVEATLEDGAGARYLARDGGNQRVVVHLLPLADVVRLREAAQIHDPYIANVVAVGAYEGLAYAVTQYVPGRALSFTGTTPPPADTLLRYIEPLVRALARLLSRGVVHQQLTVEHIIVTRARELFLTGLALPAPVGNAPPWQAPEVRDGGEVTVRGNFYNVGAILFGLLTGKPYEGEPVTDELWIHRPELQPATIAFIEKCLHEDPDQRFETIASWLAAFNLALHEETHVLPVEAARAAPVPAESVMSLTRRWPWLLAAAVVLLAITGGAFLFLRPDSGSENAAAIPTTAPLVTVPTTAPTRTEIAPTPRPTVAIAVAVGSLSQREFFTTDQVLLNWTLTGAESPADDFLLRLQNEQEDVVWETTVQFLRSGTYEYELDLANLDLPPGTYRWSVQLGELADDGNLVLIPAPTATATATATGTATATATATATGTPTPSATATTTATSPATPTATSTPRPITSTPSATQTPAATAVPTNTPVPPPTAIPTDTPVPPPPPTSTPVPPTSTPPPPPTATPPPPP